MMALMNSWDLKDENNAMYERTSEADDQHKIYVVSDLGASFGTTGYSWTQAMAKGNLKSYSHSKFIGKVHPEFVDFNVPTRPALIYFFHLPGLIHRLRMRWIGRHIPREDAKWMGDLLSRLSPGADPGCLSISRLLAPGSRWFLENSTGANRRTDQALNLIRPRDTGDQLVAVFSTSSSSVRCCSMFELGIQSAGLD